MVMHLKMHGWLRLLCGTVDGTTMFNFQLGKKKVNIKDALIVSGVLGFVVTGIANFTSIPKKDVWCFVDQITLPLNNDTIESVKLHIPEIVLCRAIKTVDGAIKKVTPEYNRIIEETDKKYKPRYSEKPVDKTVCSTPECQSLGGEMRICSPWVPGCTGVLSFGDFDL